MPGLARSTNRRWLTAPALGMLVSTVLAATTASTAFANQDDVPVPLVPAEALLRHTPGWLTGSAGEADLAIYP